MATIPSDVWALVKTMHSRFAGNYPKTEDGARSFMEVLIGQIAFSFPNQGWCWKKSAPGHPPSKDGLAREWGGRFEGWDIFISAGVQGPTQLAGNPAYYDLTGQVPIVVAPRDVLGTPPVTVPPVNVPPATNGTDERFRTLERRMQQLEALVANLGVSGNTGSRGAGFLSHYHEIGWMPVTDGRVPKEPKP